MKKVVRVSACLLVILLVGGCLGTPKRSTRKLVEFGELVAHPQRYRGSQVCTEGVYASGFETNALGMSTHKAGEVVYLTEPTIWIEGAEIRARGDCLEVGGSSQADFCPVEACGIFESGGGFGHLGGYEYQLAGA